MRRKSNRVSERLGQRLLNVSDVSIRGGDLISNSMPAAASDNATEASADNKRSYTEVTIETPGFQREDLNVHLDGSTLMVQGVKDQEDSTVVGNLVKEDQSTQAFERHISLSEKVDPQRIDVFYQDEVLRIRLYPIS